jgi:osmotically-inducible protein OsmY
MDLLRSGTLAALLLVLPGAAGCQALFSKARIESPEEAAISKAVKARLRLAAEKTVNLNSVEVETNSGTVYLSGVVASLAARERALKLAWEVKGVQTVVNHLEVEK